ncbi:MAG: DUF2723 domain-containing protein [Candidatus Sumerlaeia bacterium]|nr:DUF2723 domain-containing protein [Candidatus Sumerlaeia bacterium]
MTAPSPVEPAWRMPAMVGALAAAVYAATAARAPQFGDGLEFVAAAAVRGVPHPTGYPLLTSLLAPFARGEGAYFRSTLVCALVAALAAAFVCRLVARAIEDDSSEDATGRLLRRWLPPAVGLAAAFSASLWSAATQVEVYGLNALLLVTGLLALAPCRVASPSRLAIGGVVLGIGVCNHLTSLCLAPLLGWRLLEAMRACAGSRRWALAAAAVGGALVGVLPLALIPLRAAANPPINWGAAHTLEGFVWVLSGGDYKHGQFLQARPGTAFTLATWLAFAWHRVVLLATGLGAELLGGVDFATGVGTRLVTGVLGAAGWALAGWGWLLRWRRDRAGALALAAPTGLQVAFLLAYNIPDASDYLLGVWVTLLPLLAVGVAAGLRGAARALDYGEDAGRARRLLVVLAAPVVLALPTNLGTANRAGSDLCAAWIERLEAAAPERAVVLTHGDYDTYALWYAQFAEGRRRDLLVVGGNFLRSAWYGPMLEAAGLDGREVRPEPGDVFAARFTAVDHVEMLRRAAIEPNIGRVPVMTTWIPAEWRNPLAPLLAGHYEAEARAVLLAPEEVEAMAAWYPSLAPPLLMELLPRAGDSRP